MSKFAKIYLADFLLSCFHTNVLEILACVSINTDLRSSPVHGSSVIDLSKAYPPAYSGAEEHGKTVPQAHS